MTEYSGYIIEGDNTFGMKLIKQKGKGAIPTMLQGRYTTTPEAMKAIDHYKTSGVKKTS